MKAHAYSLAVGLIGLLVPVGASAQSSAAEDTGSVKAGIRFQQAVELYREGSYEGALAEFRKAYQISPSYRVLYNIAQTQYALHDFVSAYRSLKQYVAEGGAEIPADRRAQVDDMSAKLAERIARLQIGADADGADIRIDDVSVGKSPLEEAILVNVGTHKVSAVKAGSPEAVRVITVAGKETLKVGLHLDAPEVLSPVRAPSTQRVPMVVKTETKGPKSCWPDCQLDHNGRSRGRHGRVRLPSATGAGRLQKAAQRLPEHKGQDRRRANEEQELRIHHGCFRRSDAAFGGRRHLFLAHFRRSHPPARQVRKGNGPWPGPHRGWHGLAGQLLAADCSECSRAEFAKAPKHFAEVTCIGKATGAGDCLLRLVGVE